MLPTIAPEFTIDPLYQNYLKRLEQLAFSGEIRMDYASRLAVATDNSIYQVIPQAVILPKTTEDIAIALTLGSEEKFQFIKFSPRGGGTGVNGQSLSSSIIIDCSKYMRHILEVNIKERWVRVQPGVIQDQLNEYLLPFGMHFAPEISPSNRATIGGMINTDACGNGQKILGRTSDHVVEMTGVLSDGTVFSSVDTTLSFFSDLALLLSTAQPAIQARFPKTPRTLSGYNLLKAYTNQLNLNYLLCGSEGTLAVISECKLKLTPIPTYKKLVVLQYRQFEDALRALNITSDIKPLVIECIDEKLLQLAREDSIYFYIKDFIECKDEITGAVNLVEFISDDPEWLAEQTKALSNNVNQNKNNPHHAIGYYIADNLPDIKKIWGLRKKSVGLISKNKVGTRRPIPFIEDTAVSPEHLVNYIAEFKTLLNHHQLSYGMYGHVDAGCVHVRPALDLQHIEDRQLHQHLSEKIVVLLQKYNGVMWGEHGMGFRSSFNPVFFGEELYLVIRKIKTLFDPHNKLNPGKVAIPLGCNEVCVPLSGPLRGQFDQSIPRDWQDEYSSALVCNGNGACFNYSTQEIMCPSFKVTKDRVHSPKGRAAVMREWLRQLKQIDFTMPNVFESGHFLKKIFYKKDKKDFSHEVFSAFEGCLGCKACLGQCPLNVDIPELKSKFLALYHQRYLRPLRDYFIASIERLALVQAYFPRLTNIILQSVFTQWILKKFIRLADVPTISDISVKEALRKRNMLPLNVKKLTKLSVDEKENTVIILPDVFSYFYRPELILKSYDLLTALGFTVYVSNFFINGKPYHVKGFLNTFKNIANRNIHYLNQLAMTGISIMGIDPSMTLTYRDEYHKIVGLPPCHFNVLLPQECLTKKLSNTVKLPTTKKYLLLSHCTEKSMCIASETEWINVFSAFGLSLKPLAVGCCGMSGAYGHELEHLPLSRELFTVDWLSYLNKKEEDIIILATGYSCHTQAKRFQRMTLQHPLEALAEAVLNASLIQNDLRYFDSIK
jgi:FAD/FMN-containing dehydrogenase/Fe-S oxidoreductase